MLSALAAYSNSFSGVFVNDDQSSIVDNPTIRHLWPIGGVLSPPSNGETVTARPLLNLSFAINYALGGTKVWGYHVTNLGIHILAALLLFGILRRTLAAARPAGAMGHSGHARWPWRSPCSGPCIRCRPSRSPTLCSGQSRWWACCTC